MTDTIDISGYVYADAELNDSHGYLLPAMRAELGRPECEKRLFDLGCGNGSIGEAVNNDGWDVTGVDVSSEGIAQAQARHPHLTLRTGSAYDDLAAQYGTFPAVVSLEMVEHLYDPRHYARTLVSLLEPGGIAIVSTPYHDYWKNLVLALTGKIDAHWDHGHIKFPSIQTLTTLLTEAGFETLRFERVGRVPPLAKSMIAIARKPG